MCWRSKPTKAVDSLQHSFHISPNDSRTLQARGWRQIETYILSSFPGHWWFQISFFEIRWLYPKWHTMFNQKFQDFQYLYKGKGQVVCDKVKIVNFFAKFNFHHIYPKTKRWCNSNWWRYTLTCVSPIFIQDPNLVTTLNAFSERSAVLLQSQIWHFCY